MLFSQKPNRSQIDEGSERGCQFVIAGSNSTESLNLVEETLHQVPLFVEKVVAMPWLGAVLLRRNGIGSSIRSYVITNVSRTVRFISENVTSGYRYSFYQWNSSSRIVDLTTGKHKMNRIPQTINDGMDFCGFSTTACSDKLIVFGIYPPFFAPALCGCALIEVLSIERFS